MNNQKDKYKSKWPFVVTFFLSAGIYLKEFYITKSGTLQVGDMCFLIAFLFMILSFRVPLYKMDLWLIVFVTMAGTINLIYASIYNNNSFITYTSYLIYSFFIVMITRLISDDYRTVHAMSVALKMALITQVAVSVSGKGKHVFGRYTGTFNDPNQFGYFVLSSLFLIIVIDEILKKKKSIGWIVIAAYLILLSQSSGMLLGLAIFVFLALWKSTFMDEWNPKNKFLVRFLMIIIATMGAMFFIVLGGDIVNLLATNISGFQRLIKRILTSSNIRTLVYSFIKDRSITRVLRDPWPLLYGAGEGSWDRYTEKNEIHSTMISLCYYYGIIPYTIWLVWLKNNLKNISERLVCVYIALIAEAFTLANHRQPFFWMLLVFAAHPNCKKNNSD